MNCPGHIAIYQAHQRSYRDLPHPYGRVRHGATATSGAACCTACCACAASRRTTRTCSVRPTRSPIEIERLLDLVDEMLGTFGYPYTIELSTRPEKALGAAEQWKEAEDMLAAVLRDRDQAFEIDEGGGAFYGPKLDFKLIDAIGRKWQGPTVQLDFNLPERFDLEYVGDDNARHQPVMLHRVLVGSMERFVGGLIEHYAGAFPLWLAPEQVRVLPITDAVGESAAALHLALREAGIRSHLDLRAETLGYRIRDGETMKIPYMAVIGEREAEAGTVAVRQRGAGRKQDVMDREAFIARLGEEIRTRTLA